MPYTTDDYYSLQIFKYVVDGSVKDFYISGLAEGLDSGSQLLSYTIGFVTTTRSENRLSTFFEPANTVSINGNV